MTLKADYRAILKRGRISRNWTQDKASKEIGISRSYYSDIENGRTIPSGQTLFAINEVIPIFLPFNDADRVQNEEVEENV
ncbi:helix-turn-helix domain-containing protein [Salinicoccus roseus]|uniref:helix-turn-helix domain-containing protein n=1 Tax=Salinicoccus roseus TaxID=45670 RepID=UPI0035625EFD